MCEMDHSTIPLLDTFSTRQHYFMILSCLLNFNAFLRFLISKYIPEKTKKTLK